MKILVTGGAGFIGSHVAEAYIAKGHDVVVVDNLSTGKKINIHPKAKFYEIDIRDGGLEKIFETEKPDIVNHQAASTDVRKAIADPITNADVNILGTVKILEQCKKHGVKNFIFASTGGALYGNADVHPTPEDYPLRPISPYGIGKLTGEQYLNYYSKIHGIDVVVLRYSNVYGPRQDRKGEGGVAAVFIRKLLMPEKGAPVIFGTGEQTRDLIFVEDVAEANVIATEKMGNGHVAYNVATGKETTINRLFEIIRDAVGSSLESEHGPMGPGEVSKSCLSIDKIKREIGWEPRYNLEQGIKKTIQYFKKEYNLDQKL